MTHPLSTQRSTAGRSGVRRYAAVFGAPGVGRPAVGSALAALPVGMLSLAVLLLVQQHTPGFTDAAAVVGLLGAGTGVGMAVQGRLIDRFGQPGVLLPAAGVQLAAVLALVAAARGSAPLWVLGGLAVLAGLSEPQVGGGLRGLWPDLVPAELLDTANAVSSVLFIGPVLLGPLVLAGLLVVGDPAVAVLSAAGCFAAGTWVLARSGPARGWRPAGGVGGGLLGVLASPGVRTVAGLSAAQGVITGCLQVPAAAAAAAHGVPGRAPLLYAALSAGGLAGTLGYGARRWVGPLVGRLTVLLGLVAAGGVGCAVAAAAGRVALLAVGLFVVGVVIGPVGVCCYALLEAVTGRRVGVEAVTTVTAAGVAAFAAGTAAAGLVVDRAGPGAGFLTAATVACLAGVLLTHRRDTIDPARVRG